MSNQSVRPNSSDELLDAGTTPTEFETGVRNKQELGILKDAENNEPMGLIIKLEENSEKMSENGGKNDLYIPKVFIRNKIYKILNGHMSPEEGEVVIPTEMKG